MNSIVIVGIGALGSHLVQYGRNWPEGITVVDFDKVEAKNILSQFHTNLGKGRNKAFATQQAMSGLFGTSVKAFPHRLTQDNVDALLGPAGLIIDCTDNIATRLLIQNYAKAHGTPCLHGALDATGTLGRIVWTEYFTPDAEGTPGQATCEGGEALPFHGLVAAQMALIVQQFLKTGKKVSVQMVSTATIRLT